MKLAFTCVVGICLLMAISCLESFAQAPRQEQVIEAPFDFDRNEILLQVKVNGKGPFRMMLDTGADPSAIDLATAREIGLKLAPTGRQGSGGGSGINLSYETELPLVEVGGLAARNLTAVAIDLSNISQRWGKPIQGVLGHSLLHNRVIQIDYPKQVVRFYAKSPFSKVTNQANTSTRTVLSFRYANNVLVDDVWVNGKRVVAELDTGSDGTFKLTPAAVTYLGLEGEVSKAQATKSVGFNGIAENSEGKVGNVTIGGISIEAPIVIFFGKGTGRDNKAWGINIGNAFLKDFVLTIDYRSKLIVLEKS
jgi:predicted aspartyl protease